MFMSIHKLIANEFSVHQPKKTIHQSNLDIDPMTLTFKLDLDMVKIFNHAKNEVSMSRHSSYSPNRHTDTKINGQAERQTHRQY